jgi:2,3-bisphosphoglycerate-independent phosphoglycerate mutase
LSDNYKPIVLCILDGWGIGNPNHEKYDAIKQANTPCWDYLLSNFPSSKLFTSGPAVGLPEGQMGNSEVGHMTIGGGRVIYQDLMRINNSIENGDLASKSIIQDLIKKHQKSNNSVHLFGLCSDGGVHSHLEHLIYLAKLLAAHNISVKLHLFLDGRDVAPRSASIYLKQIDELIKEYNNIEIATISGRFYAMDRDKRIDRTKLCLDAIKNAVGIKIKNAYEYIKEEYSKDISDEFIPPALYNDYLGIQAGDSVLFTNFRSDRIRQIAEALLDNCKGLEYKIGMTNYSKDLSKRLKTLFEEQEISNSLGEALSIEGKKQLRLAETEKYAHVTFFFNGGDEEPYQGEDRILIPSPKVQTYDLLPEMSSTKLTEELIKAIENKKHDLIIVNYANADMVGHSGKFEAATKAVEAIDGCLEKIHSAIEKSSGALLISADHGNIESMFDEQNDVAHTSHTLNPVPFILVANNLYQSKISLKDGDLSDIAPTILQLMNVKKPSEMTGSSLIRE